MKTITTAVAVLLTSIFMTACGNKESAAPAEAPPAATTGPAEAAPADAAPAATSEAPAAPENDEDASQTSGDKVAPRNESPPPSN